MVGLELNRKEHQSEEKDNQEIENNSKNKDYDQTPKDSQQSSQKWSLSQKVCLKILIV